MRRIIFFLILVGMFFISAGNGHGALAADFDEKGWNVEKSTHFVVYYKKADKNFVLKAQDKAEGYYASIADELGFNRFDFWLWDNRAKIYIYNDADDYQQETGLPAWSGGAANHYAKVIKTFPWAQGFVDSLLPHELGHIIFREFVGDENGAPVWVDEGVAMYHEKSKHLDVRKELARILKEGRLITLDKLSNIDIGSSKDTELVDLFYTEAFSVIDYLVKEFGKDNFIDFCRGLKEKKSFDEAIYCGYKVFKNLDELNKGWLKWIES